jgi:DNA-binding CsgD family transcriptional regulator
MVALAYKQRADLYPVEPLAVGPKCDELLSACDVVLEAVRASLRLASVRSTPTRLYSLGPHSVLELDNSRVLVMDQENRQLSIFPNIQRAAEHYEGVPLILQGVQPALLVRSKPIDSENDSRLTPTDRRYLTLLMRGLGNKQIAARLNMAESTVKNHLSALYARFGAHSRAEMVTTAVALGLMPDADEVFDRI